MFRIWHGQIEASYNIEECASNPGLTRRTSQLQRVIRAGVDQLRCWISMTFSVAWGSEIDFSKMELKIVNGVGAIDSRMYTP